MIALYTAAMYFPKIKAPHTQSVTRLGLPYDNIIYSAISSERTPARIIWEVGISNNGIVKFYSSMLNLPIFPR